MSFRVENPKNLRVKNGKVALKNRPLREGSLKAIAQDFCNAANRLYDAQHAKVVDRKDLCDEPLKHWDRISTYLSLFPADIQSHFFVANHEIDYAGTDCYAQMGLADALTAFDWATIDDDSVEPQFSTANYQFYKNITDVVGTYNISRGTLDEQRKKPSSLWSQYLKQDAAGFWIHKRNHRRLVQKFGLRNPATPSRP